jgi:hypoxanthine phosphoribosyltransferase
MDNPKVKTYSWNDLDLLASCICESITNSGYMPEIIISILRGGSFPGLLLSHRLSVRNLFAISISTTDNEDVRATRHCPKIENYFNNKDVLSRKKILLVDDVVNTGKTMDECCKYFLKLDVLEIRTACLVRDTYSSSTEDNSLFKVDYVGDVIPCWAKFPWEKE